MEKVSVKGDYSSANYSSMQHKMRKKVRISREAAIKIFCIATDKDDPFWDSLIEEHYDEKNDSWPTIYDVLEPLGVTREEIDAVGIYS